MYKAGFEELHYGLWGKILTDEEYKEIIKREELFKSVDGLGENNCIFLCFIDTNREGLKYGALGALGAVGGGAIAGVAAFSSGIVDGMNRKSDGYLINWTENGLGIIPLDATGVMLTLTPAKLKADTSSYFFVSNEQIESIVVKKFNIFNSSTKKVIIALKNNQKLHLMARLNEKLIPYQNENLSKFADQYKK